jgi:hypothetical protein
MSSLWAGSCDLNDMNVVALKESSFLNEAANSSILPFKTLEGSF